MPRTTELKSEEAAVSSPLRRSCRIVAVNSPHPVKGRRLSAASENNGTDEKNESKPSRAKRGASVTKEDIEKIEQAKPRTRRSSATAEPAVVEEEKREPVTRSRRSSATEEPSQEPLKPVKTRRRSITDDSAKTPAAGKSTEGDGKSKPVTRRRSISKEPSDESVENKPATRSRRRSMDKDVDVEILEKRTTRQRRASTEKLEEPETKLTKLTPIKNKRRPSVTDNAVVLEPIEEVEPERKSLSPAPANDTSSKPTAASVIKKPEPSKVDLDLSIINECSFTEGNDSHTEETTSTSAMCTEALKERDQMEPKTKIGVEEIEKNSAAPADSTTPKELKIDGGKSTTPKKSPRFRSTTDSETAADDIGTKAQNNTEDPKSSPELKDDVKKETSSEAIPNKSETSKKITPEKVSKPAMDIETTKSLDKPKQTSPETSPSPRKSPRILARKENNSDQIEKEVRALNSTMDILEETKTITSTTEKIQSPTPDKENPKSVQQTIVDPKDADLKGAPQKELNIEDDSVFLPKSSESKESQIKESSTHISSGSEDSFRFHLSNSRLDSPGEAEEDDVLNVSKSSNSSDKENIAVDIDNDSVKSKAPLGIEKRVLGDLSILSEKLIDLKQATTVARVSNVFRPKNLEFSFVEPMDVDKTSVDLESTTSEKLDRTKLLSGATDDSIDESFRLNLSMTPVESDITIKVFDTPTKVIDTSKKVIDTPKKVIEIDKDKLDVSSEKVIPKSNTVESDELIVDVSEASCATPAVESEDVSNISISMEMKEESIDQVIPDTANNSNLSTILKESVNKPDEQGASKIVEDLNMSTILEEVNNPDEQNSSKLVKDQSGDEKTIMSPEYDFQLPSDESSSEVDNKLFECPPSPSKDESRASNVEKENKDLANADKEIVDNKLFECPPSPSTDESKASNVEKENQDLVCADKELEPSDKEICGKLPVEQHEQSSTTIILIESEEIDDVEKQTTEVEETTKTSNKASSANEENIVEACESDDVGKEKTEMEETAKTPDKSCSATENEENIVETGESDDVEKEKTEMKETAETPTKASSTTETEENIVETGEPDDVEKEKTEMKETAETPTKASSTTETEENIVETGESEMVINQELHGISEKSPEKSIYEENEKDIGQKHESSNIMDEVISDNIEAEIENIPEGDKSTINSSIIENKEIDDNPNVALENISENENHTNINSEGISIDKKFVALENISENENHTNINSEGISIDKKFQIDDQDEKTTEKKEMTSEKISDDLKDEQTTDDNSPPEITNIKTFTEVQTRQSPECVKIPLGIELIKTSDVLISTEVPAKENNESSRCSINTNIDNDRDSNEDAEYEEMERSFQDIVKDDEVELEKKSESPISQSTKKIKKSETARQSKGEGFDDMKSDINERLVEQHSLGTDSPQKMRKSNLSFDNSEARTESSMLVPASSKTPKKGKKKTKNHATAHKTDETADTEQDALSTVDNASGKALVDQQAFDFKLPKDKRKSDRIDTEDVASNLGETDIDIETKSTKDNFKKTPKKTKKRAKVITLADDSTESVPTEGPTSDEMESTSHFSKRTDKTKRMEMSESHENGKNGEGVEKPKTKKKKNKKSKLDNFTNTSENTHEKHPLEGFRHPKLDEIIDKMVMETKRKKEHVNEDEGSSENEYASEEDEEESRVENTYLDTMAEEGEEDTPSEGSNDIIDDGESINTTESERETDDDYDNSDSFICDDDVIDLLSGDDEFDLGDEKSKKKKKSRIINVEKCNSDVIRIERKEKPVEPKRRSRIISVSSSSGDEEDESLKEVVQVSEHEPSVELKDEESSEKPRNRKSSITIIENINVNDIRDTVLSQRIHNLVDSFCTTIPRQGDISMNLSLEYADKDEEPSTETNKEKSPRSSLSQTSPKKTKKKKVKDGKKRGSSGDEAVVPPKKPKLSESLDNFEDLQDAHEESNKRKSKSLEDINIKKNKKKKKKSARKISEVEEDSEVSNKKRKYSENDLRSKTFSLLNQLITDVKNRPRRAFQPSTSKVDPSIDDSWQVEVATDAIMPSTSIVSQKEIEKYKFHKVHPKDFKTQMLYGSSRVKRIETTKLLKKKGAYS